MYEFIYHERRRSCNRGFLDKMSGLVKALTRAAKELTDSSLP